jgi:membrane fusion protein, heavy metal efflux system
MKYLPIILFFLLGCQQTAEKPTETASAEIDKPANGPVEIAFTKEQAQMAGIKLGQPERRAMSQTLKVSGVFDVPPQNMVTVSVPFGGYIRKIPLEQGMFVKQGQPLVVLENPDYVQVQQDYLETKAKLDFADLDYARQEALSRENVGAAKVFQQTRANRQTLQAQLAGLAQRLAVLRINPATLRPDNLTRTLVVPSPVSGYITAVPTNAGKFVNPADVIAEITNLNHLHIRLTIFEKDLPQIHAGQHIRFGVGNEAEPVHNGTIFMLGKSVSADRTVSVLAHPDENRAHFIPGAFVTARVQVQSQSVLTLPEAAIVSFDGQSLIYVQIGQNKTGKTTFRQVVVQTGTAEAGYVAVTLPAGTDTQKTPIVVAGAYSLLSQLNNKEEE